LHAVSGRIIMPRFKSSPACLKYCLYLVSCVFSSSTLDSSVYEYSTTNLDGERIRVRIVLFGLVLG
jgi:hypothetical protein